ncbi:MAG: galactose-1-phosphate uridylyltransferase [Candidatus Sumerlaeota bacterium]|nr:galactose-1-phosphate uridylyltransferase [Candidatus Sumerlaeota bacterium]
MPELRKDPVIGRWIIVATERANRPQRYHDPKAIQTDPNDCPFCVGHEGDTPSEVLSYRQEGLRPNGPGWWVRVVPNKFPALQPEGPVKRVGIGMYDMVSGIGAHEVVIESPDHEESMGTFPMRQVEEVLWSYRDRVLDLKRDTRFQYILIFKNHGAAAGASIDHPHSQIIALPIVPKRVQEEMEGAQQYWRFKERCVFCDIINQEQKDQERILQENDSFVALAPFASRFPYEVWIMPKKHSLHFHDIQKNEVRDLAEVLHSTLARLRIVLNDPPYNYIIHTAPVTGEAVPYFHWHIEVIPKMSKIAGFEWATGFYINPTPPETAARFLTEVSLDAPQVVEINAPEEA